MNKLRKNLAFISIFALILLVGCDLTSRTSNLMPIAPGMPETLAAQTWSVMQTSAALSATDTGTPGPPTETPTLTNTPTNTNTPTPTRTPVPMLTAIPTNTPGPTWTLTSIPSITPWYYPGGGTGGGGTGGTGGITINPCLEAKLVRDITIPDGQYLPTNQNFVKVWRIQNTGSCTWDNSVTFGPTGNQNPFDASRIHLPKRVRPGNTIDLAVDLQTPNSEGKYTGYWKFRAGGETFGNNGNTPFNARVNVDDSPPTTKYNFATQACAADWETNARYSGGRIRLTSGFEVGIPCDGRAGYPGGFIRKLNTPNMENGEASVPGIWENPPYIDGGAIQGRFPAMLIFSGDHFKAEVGCRNSAEDCDVTFELKYQVIDPPSSVIAEGSETRHETYDGSLSEFNLDLGSLGLSGKYVSFLFRVRANNKTDENQAVWVGPRIDH
jgi:hypothetical protein